MAGSIMARAAGALALWLVTITALAQAQAPAQTPRWFPAAGTYPYRFETSSVVPNMPGESFRLDYDLVSDGKGVLVAVVKGAWRRQGAPEWSDAEVDAECRKAMGAQGDELARIKLWPFAPEMAANLGKGLVADCAPTELFFPLTEVLTVVQIQVSPQFGLEKLAKPGDTYQFAPYKIALDRDDTVLDLQATGGTLRFDAAVPGRATIGYHPNPSNVTILHRRAYNGADVTLKGTASGAMKLEIDPGTGVLLGAEAVGDRLDVTMSLPGDFTQPLAITREVKIAPRP